MDAQRSSVTICARARGFRPVLFALLAFWLAVLSPAVFGCTWTVTYGTGAGTGDAGYVYPYTGAAFCIDAAPSAWGGVSPGYSCSMSGNTVNASGTLAATGELWFYVIGGTGEGCPATEPDDPTAASFTVPDAVDLGWGVGSVWIAVGAILFLLRAVI